MTSTRKIFLDSAQRSYGETYNYAIGLREPIHNIKGIRLAECYLPNSFYNITNDNKEIKITDGGGTDTLSIAIGNYPISTLLTTLQTAANASGTLSETYTFSYSTITGLVSISATGNFSITTGNLFSKLGFVSNTGLASSHTATAIADLRPTKSIYVAIQNISIYSNFNAIVNGVIGKVENNDTFLSILTTDIDYEMINMRNTNSISSFEIALYDDNGRILSNNGINWNLTLELEIEE